MSINPKDEIWRKSQTGPSLYFRRAAYQRQPSLENSCLLCVRICHMIHHAPVRFTPTQQQSFFGPSRHVISPTGQPACCASSVGWASVIISPPSEKQAPFAFAVFYERNGLLSFEDGSGRPRSFTICSFAFIWFLLYFLIRHLLVLYYVCILWLGTTRRALDLNFCMHLEGVKFDFAILRSGWDGPRLG